MNTTFGHESTSGRLAVLTSATSLQARRVRRRDGLAARLLHTRLDAELARGLPPEGRWLRAVRADQLVALSERQRQAQAWADVLTHAPDLAANLAQVPLNRPGVQAAAPLIGELVARLQAPAPVPAQAVAISLCLLTDGVGPLYSRRARPDLAAAVGAALAAFDLA